MYKNKFYPAILFLFTVLLSSTAVAQAVKKRNGKVRPVRQYSFVLYGGGGMAGYVADVNTQPIGLQTNIKTTFPYGTVRLMWHPNYRLRLGFETGYTNFYSYSLKNGNTSGKVSLSAIPLLVVWSIPIVKRVNLFAGFGTYVVTTHLNYSGKVKSTAYSLGSNVAINYVYPLSKKLGLATEAKWLNAFQTKDNMLALQVQLVWKFLEY